MTVASIANAIARGVLALPLGIANRCRAAAVPCHHACCVSFALRTPLMRVWVCAFAPACVCVTAQYVASHPTRTKL